MALEESDAKWVRPTQCFIDKWEAACVVKGSSKNVRVGYYNEDTGFFELNGITDIGYEEAVNIYRLSVFTPVQDQSKKSVDIFAPMYGGQPSNSRFLYQRTYFPIPQPGFYQTVALYNSFKNNAVVEVVTSIDGYQNATIRQGTFNSTFQNCSKLREIKCTLEWITAIDANTFSGCAALESVKIDLSSNSTATAVTTIDLHWSPSLSYDSLKFMVDKGAYRATTVKVHANVYAAMQGQATYPFNGGSLQEWEQLLVDAAGKNLTFATA